MRMIRRCRFRDERGVSGVMFAVLLVVFLGMLALSLDGGLLYSRFRSVRNANDAASLAAALSCANKEGRDAAETQANLVAGMNATGATTYSPFNLYESSCDSDYGRVIVHYEASQTLYVAPAIGVSSPRSVRATATAAWGAAGGMANVAPLMLSAGRLSTCDVPNAAVGTHCFFWWDNGTGTDTTVLTNAEWGLMDLDMWNVGRYASCPGNVNQSDVTTWIRQGFPGTLTLAKPGPTYVCRGSGFQGGALNQDIDFMAGQRLIFPVNDPSSQVDSSGAFCPPGADCTVQKYAIVAFGVLEIVGVWTGNDAQDMCGHPAANNGSLRCLEAIWQGTTSGVSPGTGPNFGVIAVALTE